MNWQVDINLEGALLECVHAPSGLMTDKIRKNELDKKFVPNKRGKIRCFTAASRRRLLKRFARLMPDTNDLDDNVLFITLTYARLWPSPVRAKQHLRAFLKRVMYRYPAAAGFWRMERQKRGAIHFHLLLFNLDHGIPKDAVSYLWGDVIDRAFWDHSAVDPITGVVESRSPFTRIEKMTTVKRGFQYMAKYVAKMDDNGGAVLPPPPDGFIPPSGFNNLSYLAKISLSPVYDARKMSDLGWLGRSWGVFNADKLPKRAAYSLRLANQSRVVRDFARYARRYSGYSHMKDDNNYFLFIVDSYRWRKLIHFMLGLPVEFTDYKKWRKFAYDK